MRSVRFTRSADGTALAWMTSGRGPPLVKASNWLTHLEYDYKGPVWAHWVRFLESNFTTTRYDERGCGMSDRDIGDLDFERWVEDLEAVVDAAGIDGPFVLLGVSQGAATAISYAVRHPEKVSHLVLYGGYAQGINHRGKSADRDFYKAVVDVFRLGWGRDNPAFMEEFTSRFLSDGSHEQLEWFNQLCEKSLSPETGGDLLMARADVDVTHLLAQVTVPTLVIHLADDAVVPIEHSEILARNIPGAQYVVLQGKIHILLEDDTAWPELTRLIRQFTLGDVADIALDALTAREIDVLRLICAAQSNKAIANDLGLTEKTIRNHASNLFSKLGVHSRQEAILQYSGIVQGGFDRA